MLLIPVFGAFMFISSSAACFYSMLALGDDAPHPEVYRFWKKPRCAQGGD